MGQALYRKYRSKSLSEIVGQEHITTALEHALKAGKISHAYLFTGPRGVGKTSIARILAHAVNDLPYEDESNHLDIIEIDAASNRRIDEIRDLRDKVHTVPTSARYKVYIIDEVHMLTREAFNALLKTLEEPPAHVIFILATTEAHKLPETIISRTQRYSFKPIDTKRAVEHLRSIAKTEGIEADDEALELIAEHGDGSFRDSISLLDQAANLGQKITLREVQAMLGIAPEEAIDNLQAALANGSSQDLLQLLSDLYRQGLQATSIAKQLGAALRNQLLADSPMLPEPALLELLNKLLLVPASPHPERGLEIILLEVLFANPAKASGFTAAPEVASPKPSPQLKAEIIDPMTTAQEAPPKTVPRATEPASSKQTKQKFTLEMWPTILETLKKKHSTLYSVLRMCQPTLDGQTLTLHFGFAFHQKQMNDAKNLQKLHAIIDEVSGESISVICKLDASGTKPIATKKNPVATKDTPKSLDTISNIFGSAEVLDS